MTAIELLALLNQQGVVLSVDGAQLRISAPPGSLTDALQAELRTHKAELLELLADSTAGGQDADLEGYAGNSPRAEVTLSFAQERLWLIDELEPGHTQYNLPSAVRLTGELNLDALRTALDAVVLRHECLRTLFVREGREPRAHILATMQCPLELHDVAGWSADALSTELTRLSNEPFSLASGPLLRVHVLREAPTRHVLLLLIHHIVSDGISLALLLHELADLYRAALSSAGRATPVPGAQYADFAAWQRETLQGKELERLQDYWQARLDGAPLRLDLPTDHPRPAAPSYRGDWCREQLPRETLGELRTLARAQGATLYTLLLTAFAALLHRYTRQADMLIGSPVAGRTLSATERMQGLFVNSVVIRAQIEPATTFTELLGQITQTTLDALGNQALPFEKLVELLAPEREAAVAPVFQVLFNMQNREAELPEFAGLTAAPVVVPTRSAKLDLSVLVEDREDGLAVWFEYSTDLFTEATIKQMLGHYCRLLEGLLAEPTQRVARLPLLSAAERNKIVTEWNTTSVAYPEDATLVSLFERQVAATPDAPALRFAEQSLSYTELNARANQLAHHLRDIGVVPEQAVGVLLERSVEMVVALYGVLKAGGAYLPLDPELPAARLQQMLDDATVATVLTHSQLAERLPARRARVINVNIGWDAIAIANCPRQNLRPRAGPRHAAYTIFTSGSTGRPKGVVNEHRGIVNRLLWMQDTFALDATDVVLQKTPFSFDVSVWEFFWPLMSGAQLVLARPGGHKDVNYLLDIIQRAQVTTLHFVPSMLELFLQPDAVRHCTSLRRVISSGEALSTELQQRFFALLDAELHNLYGPTEAAVDVTWWTCSAGYTGARVPIGRPIANTQIYLVDPECQPVPPGVPGELLIGGVQVARGYVNQPDLTADKFIADTFSPTQGGRLYRTGDVARYRQDGVIEYLGRNDFQVKLRGLRIEPDEISAALLRLDGIEQATVILHTDSADEPRLAAYYVSAGAGQPSAASLRAALQLELPEYMIPSSFTPLPELPVTANGKLDRRALPAPETETGDGADYQPPRNPLETALCEIFAGVLQRPRVSIHDNFFQLGGHSLLAARTAVRISETLATPLTLKQLFDNPTVATLSAVAAAAAGGAPLPPVVARDGAAAPPLSAAQQRMWILEQIEPGNDAYHIPWATRLRGTLDMGALQQAVDALLERHESLRTTFRLTDGAPTQHVLPPEAGAVRIGQLPVAADELRNTLTRLSQKPFDFEHGPLLRFTVLKVGATEHVLHVVMHHIIGDAWSTTVLRRDLAALYNAATTGTSPRLPDLTVQYADFALWQRDFLNSPSGARTLEFWTAQLRDAPAALDLPTDWPRPAQLGHRGAWQPMTVPPDLTNRLRQLSDTHNATLFMVLFAAFNVLLGRYSQQHDIVVGTPVAGRQQSALENLIGVFINTLPLRTRLQPEQRFSDLLAAVKATALEAFEHQTLAFEQLVEALQPERDTSRAPVFQAMFILQNAPADDSQLHGLELSPVLFDFGSAKLDLTLSMETQGDTLVGYLEYNTELFAPETIERLLQHYLTLLESIAADPATAVGELAMLPADERHLLLVEWNETALPYPPEGTLHDLFAEQAAHQPEAIALTCDTTRLSYRELNRRANKLARHLWATGITTETLVAVCTERCADMIVALLAIHKAGAAYVPVDPEYPAQRIAHMLADSAAPLVLTQSNLLARLPDSAANTLCLDHFDWSTTAADDATPPTSVMAEHLAYVIYTSGSTGVPKGVEVEHRNAVALALWAQRAFTADELSGVLASTSICFDLSVFEIFVTLALGGRLILVRDALALPELDPASDVRLVNTVPSAMAELARMGKIPTSVTTVVLCGEPLSTALVNAIYALGPVKRVYDLYGPTEDTVYSTWTLRARDAAANIGRPIYNTQAYVLDPRGEPVPIGVPGELFLSGAGVTRGYRGLPELTAERFVPNPFADADPRTARAYRTGDQVRWRSDGTLEFLGRLDQQVKLRGHRIELGEIESVLSTHPALDNVVVNVHADQVEDPRLVAYIVLSAPSETAATVLAELRDATAAALPRYMVPSAFVVLDALPLTPNGKLDRKALPAPAQAAGDAAAYVAPRNAVESALADCWAALLGATRVGIHDDFFELGGHSLLAIQSVSFVRDRFGAEIPMMMIFGAPTIAELAPLIAEQRTDAAAATIPVCAREAPLPLSSGQQRLWFLAQLAPGDPVYNLPWMIKLSGELDPASLHTAFAAVISRHEALRTVFPDSNGEPQQLILEATDFAIQQSDCRELDASELRQRLMALARQRLDLARGPLLQVSLLRTGAREHILVLVVHHIVYDAWSHTLLMRDLARAYSAARRGAPVELPSPVIQFADYARWEHDWLAGADFARQLAYWQQQLAGAPRQLALPTDRPRPDVQPSTGETCTRMLSQAASEQMKALAADEGASLFMTLLAAFNVLLSRYSGQNDLLVGTPVSGRNRSELEDIVGFFLQTLVIRADLTGEPGFRELLARTRTAVLGALEHQDLPFETLVDALGVERDTSRHPLFQVSFVLQHIDVDWDLFEDLQASLVDLPLDAAKFDMTFAVIDANDLLSVRLEYNTSLFDVATIERMIDHFETLLLSIGANPDMPVNRLTLLPEAERQQLSAWNNTAVEYPPEATLVTLFEQQVARTPDAPALVCAERELSYRQLNARANQLAHRLIAAGIGPDVRVGVHLERSAELVIALYGIVKAGGAYVPLDPEYPQQRLLYMLEDASPALVISAAQLADRLPELTVPIWQLDDLTTELAHAPNGNPSLRSGPRDLAYVIFTSGSTGRPKGVMNEHRSICNRLLWMQQEFALTASDRLLHKTPFSFDVSVWELFWPLQAGATLVLARAGGHRDAGYLAQVIRDQAITTVHFVPSMLQAFLQDPDAAGCSSLQRVICSGEALAVELQNRALKLLNAELHNLYGPTEAAIDVSNWQCRATDSSVPLGRPGANTRIYIVEPGGDLAPIGVPGELWIAGVQVARGYINQPELTAQQFVADPFSSEADARAYRTGDLAQVRADGVIEFLGRIDQQIKLRGFRIELQEIEGALDALPEVLQSVVLLREDSPGDPRLAAYVVPASPTHAVEEPGPAAADTSHDALADALREGLAAQLPDYMIPSHFVVLKRFPLTASGKTDRRALPAPARRADAGRYIAPRNELETQLAEIWAAMLGVSQIGVNDDFFALGGHSLLATQVVSRTRDQLQVELPLLTLFNAPTVAGIAKWLTAAQPRTTPRAIKRRSQEADLPLSFAQQRLWFLNELEGPSATYSIPLALHLDGKVDIGALQAAVDCLIARHESLRTRFTASDGQPTQTILAGDDVRVAIINCPGATRAERQAEATALAQQPFDLAAESLLRVYLLRADHAENTLLLVMHHIISDGWSIGILARELAAEYAAAMADTHAMLPELPVQYADYALWQRDWLRGPELRRQLEYWETQLQGAAPLRLLTDFPRPAAQTFRGALLTRTYSLELSTALRALAEREGCTLFMVLLAAYGVLLARHAGTDDIVIGSPIAGRRRSETEGLIGFFVNTLALRLDLTGEPDFVTLLGRVKSLALNAYEHQELPFEKLVEELQPERDTAHPPLVQTLFALQNHLFENLEFGSTAVTPVDLHLGTAKFDLSLFMLEHETGLIAALEYNTDLFTAGSIDRLHAQFEQLLRGIVAAPAQPVGAVPLLSEEESGRLLQQLQPAAHTWPETRVHRLVEATAAQQPEAPALLWNAAAVTYAELNARANRLARALRAAGAGAGQLVAIAAQRGSPQVTSVLAVLKAGAAYLPLDLSYPAQRLQFMLDDSGAALVLADAAGRDALPEHTLPTLRLDGFDWDNGDPRNLDNSGGDSVYVIYTSGSTGQPKGVELTHAGLANLIQWQISQPRLDQPARTLQFAPLSFDVSFQELFTTWSQGGCAVLVDEALRQDLPALVHFIATAGIERLFLPFAALQPLADCLQPDAPALRLRDVIVAGEQLQINPAIRELFRGLGDTARLHNHYGPSETHVVTALTLAADVDAWPALPAIGQPVTNIAAYVLDARRQPVPVGMPGELYVAGVQVAAGYRNRAALNAERFSVDPVSGARMYRTGDRARLLESGQLEYLGRTDAQIKWRGFRIEPGEIEARLLAYPGVRQCAVAVRDSRGGTVVLAAYLVTEPDADTTAAALRSWVQTELPDYMVPSVFVTLDALPLTPTGKLNRAALPAPEQTAAETVYVPPRNPLEEALVQLWAAVLGARRVGVHDDFFELGGHSLLATQLLARVRGTLNVELPLLSVFAGPTVAQMATAVAAARGTVTTAPLVARARDGAVPLSFAQQRLWFLDQLEPGNPVYNLPWALELTGPLNREALQRAFDALVARHENLRTAFVSVLGKPHQEVRAPLPVPLQQLDARDWNRSELSGRLRELAREPFNLATPPLLRITLLQTGDNQHIVLIVLHHIVADGWSLGVLHREWAALYGAHCRNEPVRLPNLDVQYADFALWQQEWLASAARDAQLDYWRERLRGAPALLDLPTDHPRGPSQTHNGASVDILLPPSLHGQLQTLAKTERATLYMVCLAAFNVLLSRYTGQTDICVGTPVAGRQHSELDHLLGCFLNTLVMRNDMSGDPSFTECISRVKHTALEAFAHQDLPFEQLVDELHPVRDMSHAPLFQVAFVMQNTPWDATTRLHELEATVCELDYGVAKFDLSLLMAEREDGLLAHFEYNSDLFAAATVERLAGHLQTLLGAATSDAQRPAGRLPLLTAAERHRCLHEWNHTAQHFESQTCVQHLFEAQVANQPHSTALQFGTARVTYAELNREANQIAHWLIAAGAGPGAIVGLCVARSPQLIAALLGILKSGAAYVPLDPDYPAERLQWMLRDSQAPLLVTEHALRSALPEHTATVLCLDQQTRQLTAQPDSDPEHRATADDLAYVIYTSGSTGRPKGVMIEHRGVCNLAHAQTAAFGLGPGDRMLQFASISFDASIFEIVMALGVGATLILAAPDDLLPGAPLLQVLQQQRVSAVTLPPTALMQLPPAELPDLHTITVAGENCPAELVARWTQPGHPRRFFNLYGPTETTVWATYAECLSGAPVSIGRPISNARVFVLDHWQEPVPVGVAGELYIGGPGLARGYLNQPEQTAEKFIADPFAGTAGERLYRSGDRVRWRTDGTLEFLGRVDAQVKVRGFRIELGEVETALTGHAAIEEAVVVARGEALDARQLVAYLVFGSAPHPTLAALREHLQQRLPDFMVPQAFVALDEFPLTPNRKVDRAALPDPERRRLTQDVEFIAPRTKSEAILAAIWAAVLQVKDVGINDNFFELGGDSILSIQIIARAAQRGLRLTPKQVFQHQTIAELAVAAQVARPVDAEQGPVAGPVPLTPIQHWLTARNVTCPEHFNQSQMLWSREALEPALLEQALQLLVNHHDALRLQVEQQPGFWRQHQAAAAGTRLLRVLNLAQLNAAAQEHQQLGLANALQGDIDLTNGPLLRALLFQRGPDRPDRLLLVVHHMAVDWVSWPILLADLEALYRALHAGQQPSLPQKTTSFKTWAERLEQFAADPELHAELDWWCAHPWHNAVPIPASSTRSHAANLGNTARSIRRQLSVAETERLVKELSRTARARVDEVLLTAIAQALCDCSGGSAALLDLEGHGREDLFADVDLSRTVGWFTALYPALLQLPVEPAAALALQSVKAQLRAIPRRGIGFGVLRYLARQPELRARLRELPQPQVGFNYLGRFEQLAATDALLQPATEPRGRESSPLAERPHELEVAGLIAAGQLQLTFEYSTELHSAATVEALADGVMARLRELLAVNEAEHRALLTATDFPLASALNPAQLHQLVVAAGDVEDIYPLTPLQHGMLFHSLLGNASDVYLARFRWRLRGNLDAELFAAAWRATAGRNPSLRASFAWQELDTPVQVIHRDPPLKLELENWSELPPAVQQRRLDELLTADQQLGFEFATAPLMRLRLIRLGRNDHHFVWTFHHAIIDGWSVPLVLQEVLGNYEALRAGNDYSAPERGPFSAYVRWLGQQDAQAAARHWQAYLAGFSAATPLPLAHSVTAAAEPDYAELVTQLPAASVAALRTLAADQRVTFNTLVQGAWGLLLAHYSGSHDVVFGATTSGRPADMPGVASMVGLFLNTLPVRVRVPAGQSVADWLAALQADQLEARQYEFSPLAEVQGWSEIPRGTPLFNSLLAFENYPDMETMWTDTATISIREVEGFDRTNFPLTVNVAVFDTLQLRLVFDQQVLSTAAAEQLAERFKRLLEQMSTAPERSLQELAVLTASERDWLLNEWNATTRPYPTTATLPALFEAQVTRTPDAAALVADGATVSYDQLNQRANRLAHYLIAAGVGPDIPVGVYMERSVDLVVALYAIVKAGGAYVPLDPEYPQQRLAQMLEDAQVSWVLTHAAVAEPLPGTPAAVLSLGDITGELATLPATNPELRARPDALAYIIFTSGSTGRPKGVMNEHQGICNRLLWMQDEFALSPADRVLQKTPFSFDVSVWELFWPLQTGAALVLAKPGGHRDTLYLCELIAAQQITTIHFVPSMLAVFLDTPDVVRANSLRRIICSGEALSAELQTRTLSALDAELYNLYGPTEAAVDVTHWRCQPEPNHTRVPIGHPVANTRIYIVTPDGALAAPGATGELWIGGVQVARGYINQPELSAKRFIADPFDSAPGARVYRTGDIARLRDDGALEFLGRDDEQIKLRGYRIELAEIEAAFTALEQVTQCAVVLRTDTPGDQRLVAYLCTVADADTDELLAAVRERLPEYMVPAAVVVLEHLPLTPNGKLDRAHLPAPEWRRDQAAAAPPRNAVETTLAAIWAETLQLESVGIHDDFFELGGHSLIAMQLVSRVMARMQVQLPLDALFNSPTIAGLAVTIGQSEPDPNASGSGQAITRTRKRERRRRK